MHEELKHYGVPGMKWGIRRASRTLSRTNSTTDQRQKAAASLDKHRTKASAKVAKLENKHAKLQKKTDKYIMKKDIKAAKLEKKAYKRFTSTSKSQKLLIKASKIKVNSQKVKAKLAKNEKMQAAFKKGINDIDRVMAEKGRKYITG